MIGVVVPCYKSKDLILDVLAEVPDQVEKIYVVDDYCPEFTGKWVEQNTTDKRVNVIYHETNKGVGGAVITGFRAALEDGVEIVVKVDSDGQMDLALLPKFVQSIQMGKADYVKGNRFFNFEDSRQMPKDRLLGNIGLSFFTKLSSGYWSIMDPTNGYIAIHIKVIQQLPLDKINEGFFFESDMLFRLNTIRAVVKDIPMQARYGKEKSNVPVVWSFFEFFYLNCNRFVKRILYNYLLRDFNPASLLFIFGIIFFIFGITFGAYAWIKSIIDGVIATSGTVMLSALPVILGFQMLLSAFQYDVANEPTSPIFPDL